MSKLDLAKKENLIREISYVINRNSIDSLLNTPDFILAEHLVSEIELLDKILNNENEEKNKLIPLNEEGH